jgi:sugar lactone lactonase YvrE
VALTLSGEGHGVQLASVIEELVQEARADGTLRAGPGAAFEGVVSGTGELAFPGKVACDGDPVAPRLAIADTGHDRVLVCAVSGEVLVEIDGLYQPQGVRFDGDDALLVCETGADRVWRVSLADGSRSLVASDVASPWDVIRWHGHVVIAEAGRHRLWAVDRAGELQVLAGTGAEALVDGPGLEAVLAQPSGLAQTADGDLAFVDAEASALRVLRAGTFAVETLVGLGLFAWGEEDGDSERARLQHPLGVALAPDGALYLADTFNGLVRVWRGAHLWTVPVEGFSEPGGIAVLPDGKVVVADTGNHRVVVVDPLSAHAEALDIGRPASSDVVAGAGAPAAVAETIVAGSGSTLPVTLDLDPGDDALDPAGGPPVRVRATADDPALLREPTAWTLEALPATVELQLGSGSGRITVELLVATCGPDACRLRRTQRAYDVLLT